MDIKTKYSIGDTVTAIHRVAETRQEDCTECSGAGGATAANGHRFHCHYCHGRGHIERRGPGLLWSVSDRGAFMTVGLVSATVDRGDLNVSYMCEETGVGSGTMWKEYELFPSRDLAEAECSKRNQRLSSLTEV